MTPAEVAGALLARPVYAAYRAWHRALVWGEKRGWIA